jgi:N utilization substance protein B
MKSARRRARECALMVLYGIDVSGALPDTALERFWSDFGDGQQLDPPPPYEDADESGFAVEVDDGVKSYAERLVHGVASAQEELDAAITSISLHWRLDRMALVDRNVLRLGAFELTKLKDEVPRKVVLNEAIEIAKTFGTAESSAFINGILDRIGK